MKIKFFKEFPFYYEEASDAGGTDNDVSSLEALLAIDDEPVVDEPLVLDKSNKADDVEIPDDKSDEIKLSEDDDPIEELIVPVSKKKIIAKYPNIFKDFPYLEKAYYADQQYKEIFPTIEDANEALKKSNILDNFEQKLLSGDTTDVLSIVRNNDPNAFNKIVDNYLQNLQKVDQGAFSHVIGNVIKQTIIAMSNEAQVSKNEDLQKAALILNQYVFGSSQFAPPTKLSTGNEQTDNTLKNERAQFIKERFEVTRDDLNQRIQNQLKATINDHIDPKQAMSDYVKKNAIRESIELLDNVIANDQQFKKILDGLWQKAFDTNFSRDSISRIRAAFLSKAKSVLPQIIQKTRNEALRGLGKRAQSEETSTNKQGLVKTGKPASNSSKTNKDLPRTMKTLDYLMQE